MAFLQNIVKCYHNIIKAKSASKGMWPSVTFGGKADQHTVAAIAKAISKRRMLLLLILLIQATVW